MKGVIEIPTAEAKHALVEAHAWAKRKQQPETLIRQGIATFLRMNGWKVARIVQSALSEKGIPDLVAIREGRHVWIEVKQPKGKLSDHQVAWLKDLEDHGGSYIVARGIDDVEQLARGARLL